jgi:hypothetical protein
MPTFGMPMIIAQSGKIIVQHWQGDASAANGMRIISPFAEDITPTAHPYPGDTVQSVAVYPAGTEVIIQLYNTWTTNLENTTPYAMFLDGYNPGYTWRIDWEDWSLNDDFNDSHTFIYTTGFGNISLSKIRYRSWLE